MSWIMCISKLKISPTDSAQYFLGACKRCPSVIIPKNGITRAKCDICRLENHLRCNSRIYRIKSGCIRSVFVIHAYAVISIRIREPLYSNWSWT